MQIITILWVADDIAEMTFQEFLAVKQCFFFFKTTA